MAKCVRCDDYKFVNYVLSPGEQPPSGYSFMSLAGENVIPGLPCPACSAGFMYERLRKEAALPDAFSGARLNNVSREAHNQDVYAMLDTLFKYQQRVDLPRHMILLLHGNFGCGKTHALAIAVNEALERGYSAAFITMAELLDHLRSGYDDPKLDYADRYRLWQKVDVLAIDEVDRFAPTEWAAEKVFTLLNSRYEAPSLTIMATNKDAGEMDGYLLARIGEHVYDMTGRNMRRLVQMSL